MLDLSKKVLPHTIEVDGKTFSVKTDYRPWLMFASMLQDGQKHKLLEFDFMYEGDVIVTDSADIINIKAPIDRIKGYNALVDFMAPRREVPHIHGNSGGRVLDYNIDADLIYSAFLQQYGIDLIDVEYLHWYKFQALLAGLKDTKLNDVIGYRSYEKTNSTYEKDMLKLKEEWELPQKLSEEEADALEKFNSIFK